MLKFTNGRLINGLLFVDWISDYYFGIMTTHIRNLYDARYQYYQGRELRVDADDRRNGGMVVYIWKGKIETLREDDRKIKN